MAHAALGPVLGRKGAAFSAEGQAPPGMEKKWETHQQSKNVGPYNHLKTAVVSYQFEDTNRKLVF